VTRGVPQAQSRQAPPPARLTYRAYAGAEPEPIGFLLVPQFSMMAFLSAVEPLRVANRLAGRELFAWHAYSGDGAPVQASNGMRIMVEAPMAAISAIPTLLVCAGFEPERYATRAVARLLRRLARAGVVLGALDSGAFRLAKAGLLEGVTVTMHWEAVPAFRESFPQVRVADELYEIDGGRITVRHSRPYAMPRQGRAAAGARRHGWRLPAPGASDLR